MAVDRGIPQQRASFFLGGFKMGSINFELVDELCGVRTVVGTTEKMQERHGKALSKELGRILAGLSQDFSDKKADSRALDQSGHTLLSTKFNNPVLLAMSIGW